MECYVSEIETGLVSGIHFVYRCLLFELPVGLLKRGGESVIEQFNPF
jgi:hypothetical protein